jgi:adenylosuccinate synthase
MVMVIVGGQWGDEGKGKVTSYLCLEDRPRIVARAGTGPNAGHTVQHKGRKYGLRLVPSGFLYREARLLIGAGVLVDPGVLLEEIRELEIDGRIGVDRRCGIIEKEHIEQDRRSQRLSGKIGTTGTGCGPANMERANRTLKQAWEIPAFEPYLADVPAELDEAIRKGEHVLVECSQGIGLSVLYGTYPYVTSKDTTASTALADVGLGPKRVEDVVVVFKSFPSRVGAGPFPTEMSPEEAERLGIEEFGTVTGRKRRTGWFDFEMARTSAMINSATQIALTCIDYVDREARGKTRYEELPTKARKFVEEVEEKVGVPVTLISTGPEMEEMIDLRREKLS